MIEIQTLSAGYLERGLATPLLGSFWNSWRSSSGYGMMVSDIPTDLASRITLSLGTASEGLSPDLLVVGPNSFAAQCYGPDWARQAPFLATTPDQELERLAAPGYHMAMNNDCSMDIMSVISKDNDGRGMRLLYERLIVPIYTRKKRLLIGCMTAPLKPIEWLPKQDVSDPPAYSSTIGHHS